MQLENIVNVRMLDLRENKITKLPDEIHCLQLLERLDVSNNDLSALPFTLGVLPHLKSVQLEGNSLKTIRRDIISRGTVGLLKYLRSRLEECAGNGISLINGLMMMQQEGSLVSKYLKT